jgi:hypothetical protein
MQTIFPTSLTPAEYVEQQYQEQVPPPEQCPHCHGPNCLEALGYYSRFVTQVIAAVLEIMVRRFRCRRCRISVSCLPAFAQPYRVVNSTTVEAAFNGEQARPDVQRWELVLRSYWQSFQTHQAELVRRVGPHWGAIPLQATAREFWERCVQRGQGLARITQELIARFRTCLFGTYRCHQPEKQARKSRGK